MNMTKRTVEIDDTLDEIIESAEYDVEEMAKSYLNDNPDMEEAPDLYNDLDYDGSYHEIIDGSVPIYDKEIEDLFYLYGNKFERAFDDAGIGKREDDCWPMGWKAAAIYCYIDEVVRDWYEDNKDDIYEDWREEHPLDDDDEDEDDVPIST